MAPSESMLNNLSHTHESVAHPIREENLNSLIACTKTQTAYFDTIQEWALLILRRPINLRQRNRSVDFRFSHATHGTKAFLEFVDTPLGVYKLSKPSEEWMGIRSDTNRDEAVFHAVDHFLFFGGLGRTTDKTFPGGHINEDDRIVFRMKVLFHEI